MPVQVRPDHAPSWKGSKVQELIIITLPYTLYRHGHTENNSVLFHATTYCLAYTEVDTLPICTLVLLA